MVNFNRDLLVLKVVTVLADYLEGESSYDIQTCSNNFISTQIQNTHLLTELLNRASSLYEVLKEDMLLLQEA